MQRPLVSFVLAAASIAGCTLGGSGFTALYPPRPAETAGDPIADPMPSRIVVHATITGAALQAALEEKLPKTGEGTFPLLGSTRKFTWQRDPVSIRFTQGRLGVDLHIVATADMPVGHLDLPIDLKILAEPVVTRDYVARMQSTDVQVTSNDRFVKVADAAAGILDKVKGEVDGKLKDFSYDLRPLLAERVRADRQAPSISRSATRTDALGFR